MYIFLKEVTHYYTCITALSVVQLYTTVLFL